LGALQRQRRVHGEGPLAVVAARAARLVLAARRHDQGLVATHGLVGLIPTLALAAPRPDVAIRRLRPEPRARTLRYARGDASHPAVERFLDDLRGALARSAIRRLIQ
jgi:hypothetical protein